MTVVGAASCPHPGPLPGGEGEGGLHLWAGPIDLVCRAWGPGREAAYAAARAFFPGVLPVLCEELSLLRSPVPGLVPRGSIGAAMYQACLPHGGGFITPMAAVAGAVADAVLAVMVAAGPLERAFVNNRGDIAVHLAPGQTLRCGLVADVAAPALDGAFELARSCGVATSGAACSGRGGRSFSLGIADAVTIVAASAAAADAAATVVGNAVDLPGHAAVVRVPACSVDADSDLGERLVTWSVGRLGEADVTKALDAGRRVADDLFRAGRIERAVLALQGRFAVVGGTG